MAKQWSISFNNRDKMIGSLYRASILNKLAVAIWRHPKSNEKQVVIDLSGVASKGRIEFNEQRTGFWVAPFDLKKQQSHFINANYYFDGNELIFKGKLPYQDKVKIDSNKLSFDTLLQDLHESNTYPLVNDKTSTLWFPNSDQDSIKSVGRSGYSSLIQKAISTIEEKQLRKVVTSRALEVDLNSGFEPVELFHNLCNAYQNAFVSLYAIPGVGTWIGATPEVLLSLKNNELITVALAGTRPLSPDDESWSKTWTEKEVVEQAIVSEFIRDCFQNEGISDYFEEKTESLRIGDLLHLHTRFIIKNVLNNGFELANRILKSLHPTPAVCGVPQKKAFEFIETEERHDRSFYSGFLGPVNLNDESNLYVNLRCLQMLQHSAILYAGGGITIDSDINTEWHETELKLDALLKVINGNAQQQVMRPKAVCYD